MKQHTPGPWTTEHNAPFVWGIYGPDNNWIAQTLPKSDDGSADSPDQVEANARLIAAAPETAAERDRLREINAELLAALEGEKVLIERAQNYLRMYLEPGERRIQTDKECVNALLGLLDGPDQRQTRDASNAAIARAKGETP